jgi:hypothetical protein
MTIYIRTEEGQQAAYSPASVLPRKLRTLLKVIDGKTSLSVYIDSLQSYGNVEQILQSLYAAGYIRAVTPYPEGSNGSKDDDLVKGGGFLNGLAQLGRGKASRSSDTQQFAASTQALSTYLHTQPPMSGEVIASKGARAKALADAVDSMSSFVLTYAPEHSFLVLKELEQLTNLEQLAVTLGGYEQLISHVGPRAQEHISQIKHLLHDFM